MQHSSFFIQVNFDLLISVEVGGLLKSCLYQPKFKHFPNARSRMCDFSWKSSVFFSQAYRAVAQT